MLRAYRDMKEANWKESDKYFHARGNYDAARRGTGGRVAAAVIRWVFGSLRHRTWSRCAAAHAWVSVTAIPGKGFRKRGAAIQKTLQPIRERTAGAGMEATLTVTDQRDFLLNISLPAITRKVRLSSQCSFRKIVKINILYVEWYNHAFALTSYQCYTAYVASSYNSRSLRVRVESWFLLAINVSWETEYWVFI